MAQIHLAPLIWNDLLSMTPAVATAIRLPVPVPLSVPTLRLLREIEHFPGAFEH